MKQALLLVASLLVALLICEAIVRVVGLGGTHLTRGALHQYDADAGWICKANLDSRYKLPGSFDVRVRCNRRGLRDEAIPYEKPPESKRIVVLGDSFMWGYGVENDEMFSTRLEEYLPGAQTVNFGVNGYSTVQELVRFEKEGLKYSPDWTVLAFCTNDLQDNFHEKKGGRPVAEITSHGSLRIGNSPVRRQWKPPAKQWLRHHSRLFGFFEYSKALTRAKWKERRLERARTQAAEAALIPLRGAALEMEFSSIDPYIEPSPEMDHAWEAVALLIERIRERSEQAGGRVLVVFNANRESMDVDRFSTRYAAGAHLGLDFDRPSKRLAAIAAANRVAFVDLNPVFRNAPASMSLFLVNDGHWSAAGHDLAARTVAEKIRLSEDGQEFD
jgi:lysophospholipase L1-like esterase